MTQTLPEFPHPLDHLVLPTADLAVARIRLTALGFTVAPRGIHPFGTENCCVYFSGGTFMEPLAVGDADAARKAIGEGNVFVARDRAYRDCLGNEGFSAVVFGTQDADADHTRYVAAGVSAGDRLDFSRPFVDTAGKSDIASFRLAFATADTTPQCFLFSCERVNAPNVDRSALQAHGNGVVGIAEVVAVSADPAGQRDLLRIAAGSEDGVFGNTLDLPNATITVLDGDAFEKRFGIAPDAASNLRFAAVVFSVDNLKAVGELLVASAVAHHLRDDAILVSPVPGQGAIFVFREIA